MAIEMSEISDQPKPGISGGEERNYKINICVYIYIYMFKIFTPIAVRVLAYTP